jgi:hypothetical protein
MKFLRYSTACITNLGPFVTTSNGDSEMVALTIAQADVRISYNGDSFRTVNHNQDAVNLIHNEHGWYKVKLSTTDTGTYGNVVIACHKPGALAVWQEYDVIPQIMWDYMFSGGSTVAILDDVVEGAYTMRQIMKLMAAVLYGKAVGGGTTNVKFRSLADDADRVSAVVDSSGNRSSVSLVP